MELSSNNKKEVNDRKTNIINIIACTFIIVLPVIYTDIFRILPLLSALTITYIVIEKQYTTNYIIKNRFSNLMLFTASTFIIYIIYYMIGVGKWTNGLVINKEIILMPTYTMIFVYLLPIGWFLKQDREGLKRAFSLNKETLKYIIILLVVYLFHSLSRISVYMTKYSDITTNNAIHMIIQAFFVAALAEELFFRGYLYNVLKRITNVRKSQIITTIIFTFSHFNLLFKAIDNGFTFNIFCNYVAIIMLGIVTVHLYEKSRSLLPCIILHGLNNEGLKYLIILIINVA
ncbi:CPBP family intramembrane glutamic endopeptidase [Vallitalea longa]|uniref:CPBP family intramembrane glutamic endopeptidase n=1 Tax=Vallitalea longa TaxID=2936439 RepID=UPI002493A04F|nr:CPBP family intramembrane glutamic endopeptidase [Vallitalea longa]